MAHSKHGIFISRQKYVTNLKEIGKTACKPAIIQIEPNLKLGKAEEEGATDREMYHVRPGKLNYSSHA